MNANITNWSSPAYQEFHKIIKDEIALIANQVDARVQNFKNHFVKEAAKFVRDFKSLAKEADESLDKITVLEKENERLLRAVETEYAKLWNDWYKKCEECKYDKISYDKAYNNMQHQIKQLQAQLGDLKGKSMDTQCASDTLDHFSQKLKDENVSLEFQVLNYAKENAHLKTTYKNLFDSINVTWAQTKIITDSLQDKLNDKIYENAKLRAKLFDKDSEQKDTTKGTSANTKFANQSTSGIKLYSVTPLPKTQFVPKVVEMIDLSKQVTSNSVPTTKESKVIKNDKVIAPGMFRINPSKTSREENFVPINKAKASVMKKSITVSQPHVITKKDVNSNSNGLSSTGVDNTAKTRRPKPRSNTKNDRVPYASKGSCIKNNEVEVEEHHRNLLLSKNKKHKSSECNNIKINIRIDKSEVVCGMCKQCLITSNHDKHKPKVKKTKKVESKERLASPKPRKPRIYLRWSATGGLFDLKGKLIESSDSECQSDSSTGVDLVKGNRATNLYTINLHEMASVSPICLMARTTSTKSWLWHQRLSHLNFDTINDLAKNDLVTGLPKFKYHKEHLCPSCEQEKIKNAPYPPKPVPNSKQRLHLLHMDLCGPMRVESINGKRYVLVIVGDYSRYTWVHFLKSKDETP
ncbi:retrovirus-related pol polyprotein from transposon TNT 1-94 [Tanacetum coccineum]